MSTIRSAPQTPAQGEESSLPPTALTPRQHRHHHHHHHHRGGDDDDDRSNHNDASASTPNTTTTRGSRQFSTTNTNDNNSSSTTTSRAHHDKNASPSKAASAEVTSSQKATDQHNPLAADTPGPSSVVSGRSRTRRSRRSSASHRGGNNGTVGADPLPSSWQNGLTLCCDGVFVQQRHHHHHHHHRHQHRNIIDEVSCLVRGGRVTAVVNCCGTHSALALLAAMSGRVDCAAGTLVVNGVPVSASTYQAQMSFLEESGANAERGGGGATSDLLGELTVRENLEYASALRVANAAQAYSVDEVLQQLLLKPHEDTKVRDTSLYVRRRVALGTELLLNPSVLLLDEPMDGLATHEAQQFLTILAKLAAPSAADAEARHIMREAMAASTAPSLSAGRSASSTALGGDASVTEEGATSQSTPSRASLYTPRHSRAHLGETSPTLGLGYSPAGAAVDPFLAVQRTPTSGNVNNNNIHNFNSVSSSASTMTPAPAFTPGSQAGLASEETQRIVVVSLVQPRWALLQYVHDVVLLERSRCVFAGSVQDMLAVKVPPPLPPSLTVSSAEFVAERGGREGAPAGASTPAAAASSLLAESAPAGSYAAVAASIHRTRLNEELVHGLYRLASATAAASSAGAGGHGEAAGGEAEDEADAAAADFPEFESFADGVEATDPQPPSPASRGATTAGAANRNGDLSAAAAAAGAVYPSRSPSLVAVCADGSYTTPLSELYKVALGHMRAQVTEFMEDCAAGLLSLPEASHQAPSSIVQLFYLFHFGIIELRHRWLWDSIALVLLLCLAALLAALYGMQEGERGIQNCAGLLFFFVCCMVLHAVLSLDAQRREYAAYHRYARSGYYNAWTFLLYRAVTAALWRFGLASFVALVVFVLSNFGQPWHAYRGIFELGVIMAVLSYCCYFMMWFLCAWWPSDRVSRFLAFTFYTLNIVLAGLVLNLATLPSGVRGISYLSVMRLAYESSILTQFLGKSFGCDEEKVEGSSRLTSSTAAAAAAHSSLAPSSSASLQHTPKTTGSRSRGSAHYTSRTSALTTEAYAALQGTSCYTGAEYAAYLGFDASHRWSNVGVLAGLSGVLLLASWVLMVVYRPHRRLKMGV